jgi:tetratricopeptide (TPR) repeat protein
LIGSSSRGVTTVSQSQTSPLPSIWNIPVPRNPHFTGRDDLLRQLRTALAAGQAAALTQPQAIHGLGGVGKTQLAVEHAYRHANEYDLVWWVRAESPALAAGDLALLAQPLQLAERDARDQSVVVQAVQRELARRDRWLVIFDNAEEPRDLSPFLPRGGGHTLITSRNPNWGALAHPLDVQVLSREQAIEFLLKRVGVAASADAGELADALGCLPLALEQAGAYIESCGISLRDYLARFRARQRDVETPRRGVSTSRPASTLLHFPPATDYPATVATTWAMSFDAIAAQSAASAALLNLLAFFAPEAIPCDVLKTRRVSETLRVSLDDELQFDAAVIPLRRYSLVQVSAGMLAVHRLVQTIVRDRMDDAARRTFAEAALNCVNDAFPAYENTITEVWDIYARLFAHARAVTDETERLSIASEATARLLNQVGLYQQQRAEFAEAKALFERALKIYEDALGSNHEHVATTINNLGGVLRDLGDPPRAKDCFERALKIDEATFGPNHPNVAIRANNLGNVLRDLGDLPRAKECFERALAIGEATFGPNHPKVAIRVNNLGNVLQDLGDLPRAKACYERALAIGEATFGPNHPNVAIRVNNLGNVLQDLGDLPRAKACYERALKIDEATFGPNHPNVARDVNNLGSVLKALGDLPRAKACYERALKIDEATFGPNHPEVATDVNNLGLVLKALGDLPRAKECYERALRIFTQFLPENHPNIKIVQENLEGVQRTGSS